MKNIPGRAACLKRAWKLCATYSLQNFASIWLFLSSNGCSSKLSNCGGSYGDSRIYNWLVRSTRGQLGLVTCIQDEDNPGGLSPELVVSVLTPECEDWLTFWTQQLMSENQRAENRYSHLCWENTTYDTKFYQNMYLNQNSFTSLCLILYSYVYRNCHSTLEKEK